MDPVSVADTGATAAAAYVAGDALCVSLPALGIPPEAAGPLAAVLTIALRQVVPWAARAVRTWRARADERRERRAAQPGQP